MLGLVESARKVYSVAGDVYSFLADSESTAGKFFLCHAKVPPGGGPPPHTQQDMESFYVLDGEFEFLYDGKLIRVGPGGFVSVPPGVLHNFRNVSEATATMLIQCVPAGLDRYFEAAGDRLESPGDDPLQVSPERLHRLLDHAAAFGIVIPPPRSVNPIDGTPSAS